MEAAIKTDLLLFSLTHISLINDILHISYKYQLAAHTHIPLKDHLHIHSVCVSDGYCKCIFQNKRIAIMQLPLVMFPNVQLIQNINNNLQCTKHLSASTIGIQFLISFTAFIILLTLSVTEQTTLSKEVRYSSEAC